MGGGEEVYLRKCEAENSFCEIENPVTGASSPYRVFNFGDDR